MIEFNTQKNNSFDIVNNTLLIASQPVKPTDQINCGEIGLVPGEALIGAARRYYDLTSRTCKPQLAALIFDITGDMRALDWYVPITRSLLGNEPARLDFYAGIRYIVGHPNLDARVFGANQQDVTGLTPPAVRHLLAAHLTEVFFHRRDILESFLSQPRHFQLYTNHQSFSQDNGLAGGDYRFDREAIQLEMSRLFEGYSGPTPGAAPILHELGHMLDHFDGGTGAMGRVEGTLPGMSPADGSLFTPQARQLFIEGKRLEQQRYLLYQNGKAGPTDPIPVGHPYCFQTDGEFIAGYFEMFFRNPNYFASQNSVMYNSFATLLRQDPRQYWLQDFPGYIRENRQAFQPGQRPNPQNISIPAPV